MSDIERRVAAVEKTWARFAGRPFAFGRCDCARVAATHLRNMGLKVTGFAKAGSYSTALGARRALIRSGHQTMTAALMSLGLVEVAPAAVLPGDLMVCEGSEGLDAVTVYVGNGVILGFHEDDMAAGVQFIRLNDGSAINSVRALRL